jgi:hypothetical protein
MASSSVPPAVQELLATETSFSEALHRMLEVYHKPLRDAQYKLVPLLPEREIDEIFGNVEDLLIIADELKRNLDKRISEANSAPSGKAPKVPLPQMRPPSQLWPKSPTRNASAVVGGALDWLGHPLQIHISVGAYPTLEHVLGRGVQVGDILTNFAGIFRLYERYIINYERGANRSFHALPHPAQCSAMIVQPPPLGG